MKHLALLLAGTAVLAVVAIPCHADDDDWEHNNHIRRVLLISIDGMHAVDYQNCARGTSGVNNGTPYCPNLAALGHSGVNYVSASTSRPSDSFPGLTAIVSGGTPRTEGVYYDVAYDRSLDAPAKRLAMAWPPVHAQPAQRQPARARNTRRASILTRAS